MTPPYIPSEKPSLWRLLMPFSQSRKDALVEREDAQERNTRRDRMLGVPSWMDSLLTSPSADTSISASRTGGVRPTSFGSMHGEDYLDPRQSILYGAYFPSANRVDMLGGQSNYETRWNERDAEPRGSKFRRGEYTPNQVLRHEMGHAYSTNADGRDRLVGPPYWDKADAKAGVTSLVPRRSLPVTLFQYPRETEDLASLLMGKRFEGTPAEVRAKESMNRYGQERGPQEAVAEAFRLAVNFLSETAQTGDTPDARKLLAEMEAYTPGTGTVVNDLLKNAGVYQRHPLRGKYGWD